MSQNIRLKRSAVPGRIPTVEQLELGEIALNTYDGKLYLKQDVNGSEAIVNVGYSASYALSASNALSASYVLSSSYSVSSSFANSSSYALSGSYALTASYSPNASSAIS